jgi:sugar lactone lactonase YvrE
MAFSSAGDLYVGTASQQQYIEKLDMAGHATIFSTSTLAYPNAMAFNPAGNLYVSDGSGLHVFDPSGNGTLIYASLSIYALAINPAGKVFVATPDTISSLDAAGTPTTFATGLSTTDMAFDRAGNLFVAEKNNNRVLRFDPSGNRTIFATAGLSSPTGMAFDSKGDLYVSNMGGDTISRFNQNGVGTLFARSGIFTAYSLAFEPVPEPAGLSLAALAVIAWRQWSKKAGKARGRP